MKPFAIQFRPAANRFNEDQYEESVQLITSVLTHPTEKKKIVIKVNKGDSYIAATLHDVLKQNGLTPQSKKQSQKKITFKFGSKEQAQKALDFFNKMRNDEILEGQYGDGGSYNYKNKGTEYVMTKNGVPLKLSPVSRYVEVEDQETGETHVVYVPPASTQSATTDVAATQSSGSKTKWIIIAAVGAVVLIAAVIIMKKKGVF